MPNFYVYLISSLPMLHFGIRPPFSFERFMEICRDKISEDKISCLRSSLKGYTYKGSQPTLREWSSFDGALRNELVKIRASRRNIDPLKYLRGQEYAQPYISQIAAHASRIPSILEAERVLDQERWRKLDELGFGHYFDLDWLIVYALKLSILERWDRISSADKSRSIREVLN